VRGKTKRGKTRNKDKVPCEKVASKPNDHDWFWFSSKNKKTSEKQKPINTQTNQKKIDNKKRYICID